MKKNITINMFGQLYAIDEDAFELLNRYLDSMKRYFSDKEGGEEIADDIEHRVAELLWQQKEEGTMAISIEVIKEIIGKIGNPTEIDSQEENGGQEEQTAAEDYEEAVEVEEDKPDNSLFGWLKGRYLYRDPNDKVLGGVCSGMAQFTGKGTSLGWRLGVILAVFILAGMGKLIHLELVWAVLLLYVILWFIIPLPQTPEDRLRMKGQSVTPENINEEIINESVKASTEGRHGNRRGNGCLPLLLKLVTVVCLLPFFILVGIGMLGIIALLIAVLGLSATMFPYFATESMTWFPNYLTDHAGTIFTAIISTMAIIAIPIYCIVRALRGNGKPMSAKGTVACILLWILSIVLAIVSMTSVAMTGSKAEQDYYDLHHNRHDNEPDTTPYEPLPTDSSSVDTIGWQG